jgi:hypothetical protein
MKLGRPARVVLHYVSHGRPWIVTGQLIKMRGKEEYAPAIQLISDRSGTEAGFLLDDPELCKIEIVCD